MIMWDIQKHTTFIATSVVTTVAGFGVYYFYKRSRWNEELKQKAKKIVSAFDQKDCHIKDIAILTEKIRTMLKKGVDKLQIITDFDRTLTKYQVDGSNGYTSFQVVEKSSYIPTSILEKLDGLHRKYYPIEMSIKLTEREKIPKMIEWYNTAFETTVKAGIQKKLIPFMVKEGTVALRDGSDQFFHLVTEKKIPLMIISAGIGDIVEEVLKQQTRIPPHTKIVANNYSFDEDGLATGLKNELIHTYNKKNVSKMNKDYFESIKDHSLVILMGDSLGDPQMADGIDYIDSIIKIGFLNHDVEESLKSYFHHYDVVLANDTTLDVINVLIQSLTASS